ncbi:hypothetical protein [Cyanobacterium sp. uoEpiScrs1]|uniref:hypothetical protein n=1 Tax=Cyanobacterium sp. uoEpiScrs1 TaxID=2976343 RepID=UPI00226ACC03|nr:hypothetical protein [Cyanobacterium sp. uoEpiScrs1]
MLDQDTFQRNPDESITISGKITVQNPRKGLSLTAKLCYQLRHPYNDEIIIKIDCSLVDVNLPYTFKQRLVIPNKLEDLPYLSGEVLLHSMIEATTTRHPFQIYSNEHYLVDYTIELFNIENKYSYQFKFKLVEKTKPNSVAITLPVTTKYNHSLI